MLLWCNVNIPQDTYQIEYKDSMVVNLTESVHMKDRKTKPELVPFA